MEEEKFFEEQEDTKKEEKKLSQDELDKIKELEKLYNERLQLLAQKEKELEPLIQLQQYLSANPDKAQEVSRILSSEPLDNNIKDQLSNEVSLDNEDKTINELKKEITNLKQLIVQQKENENIKTEQERILRNLSEYKKQYQYFDEDKFFAKMLAYPEGYLDSLSEAEYQKLMDNVAKSVAIENEQKVKKYFQDYIDKKKEIAEKTKSETGSSPLGASQEKPPKVTMSNAQQIAKKLLEKFIK